MKKFFSYLIITFMVFIGCQKEPDCLCELIDDFKHNAGCSESRVDEYDFLGKKVYVFENQVCCCDYSSNVYDDACNNIGYLGSITGNYEIGGEDFSNATFVKTIWKK